MKFVILLETIAVTLGVTAAQSSNCIAYNGNACSSVLGAANITNVRRSTNIGSIDSAIEKVIAALRDSSFSEACQNYIRITLCLSYVPCSGTAWCGSMSQDDFTVALGAACGCGNACTVNGNQLTVANYYQGSSSTGPVGSAMLACQDVSLSGTMKMSVIGAAALVAIFNSIGLLL